MPCLPTLHHRTQKHNNIQQIMFLLSALHPTHSHRIANRTQKNG
jgi:hypothetical protein